MGRKAFVVSSNSTNSNGLQKNPGREKNSFQALTGLRFFAALAVVLYHFAGPVLRSGPGALNNVVSSGFVAVSFFYLLSGFVLAYSYTDLTGTLTSTRRSFWVARFARIYPAYLLAFLLAAPYNVNWTLRVNTFLTALSKLVTGSALVLTLQQAWTPWTAWYWNFPAWSVSVEAFFYLAFPFLVSLCKSWQVRATLIGAGILWLISLGPPALFCLTNHAAQGNGSRFQMALEFTPLLRLPEFLIGVLLGRCYMLGLRLSSRVGSALTYTSVVAVLVCLALSPYIPRPLLATSLLAPLFAALIYGLAQGESLLARALSLPWLVCLGEASYAIYILQIPVAYLLRRPPPYNSLLMLGFYLAILFVIALLSWHFVELPLRRRIREFFQPAEQPDRVFSVVVNFPSRHVPSDDAVSAHHKMEICEMNK